MGDRPEPTLFDFLAKQVPSISSDGAGQQFLYQCPQCRRIWFQDGKSAILDLQEHQVHQLAQRVSASLEQLPQVFCRLCLLKNGGGVVEIDEYGTGKGFGFSWEILRPVPIHAIGAILSMEGLAASAHTTRSTRLLCSVLQFVTQTAPPDRSEKLSPSLCQLQAKSSLPGFGQIGTETWIWQGYYFEMDVSPFKQQACITMLLACPPEEQLRSDTCFRLLQLLSESTLSLLGK